MSQAPTKQRTGYLVKKVQQLFRQACDSELRPSGLSMSQYAVLRALEEHPDVSSAELARLCFITRQTLQDVLRGLRNAGLATVAERPSAGRARAVTLTDAGRERLTAADLVVHDVEARMLTGLSTRERGDLADLLTRCADNLNPASTPGTG